MVPTIFIKTMNSNLAIVLIYITWIVFVAFLMVQFSPWWFLAIFLIPQFEYHNGKEE